MPADKTVGAKLQSFQGTRNYEQAQRFYNKRGTAEPG